MFIGLIALTLGITYWSANRVKNATDFYAAGRSISGLQNGLAIAGEYMSAAAFLGISGLIAFKGIDGFLYSVSWYVAFVVVLFVIAEAVRNTGRYTFADIISYRLREKPVRSAAALNTLIISLLYMIPQMIAAGVLIRLLFGIPASVAIIITGVLMTIYVMFGGMIATTWIQIIKAVLLLVGAYALAMLTLSHFNFNPNTLFQSMSQFDPKYLEPGGLIQNPLDRLSLGIGLLFGTAALPHILMRFYTVSTANKARSSVLWGMTFIGLFQILTPILGFGAALLVGVNVIANADKGGNLAAPLLAQFVGGGAGSIGGEFFMAFLSAIAFVTVIAVVSGLALAASSAFAYDFWIKVVRGGRENHKEQLFISKATALGVGAISIILALLLQNVNVAYLTGLAFAIAATANLPVLVFSLFWKRLTTTGAIVGMIGGLIVAIALVLMGPQFAGEDALFPLSNPGLVSIPVGFLITFVASVLTEKEHNSESKYREIAVRSQSGIGAE
ncbi:solute symporter family protein [Peribacillus glennii]|uniref:Cation/acetate symporter ActP n=1 Tax=Peribacillus glennii TaxID=2303991 RepID=A0A372LIB9_9BACI|nr:sodium/solute symporter [Peribacillus glennii]RFU66030.1 cation/acetate symporter ActP [Peribacillus glennii]